MNWQNVLINALVDLPFTILTFYVGRLWERHSGTGRT
jgi:hypothetical protein